jgi:hypothetical protein
MKTKFATTWNCSAYQSTEMPTANILLIVLAFIVVYLFIVVRITRIGMKKEFDREYQWLVKHIPEMTPEQSDAAILNFNDRWYGHINDFTLAFHTSRLIRLRLWKMGY